MNRTLSPDTLFTKLETLPHVEPGKLSNGITTATLNLPDTELLRTDFMFMGGVWVQDTPLQASMAVRLLKEGGKTMRAAVINERLDFYGATCSLSVFKTYSVVTVMCLKRYYGEVMCVVRDFLMSPSYEADSFSLALEQGKASLMMKMERVKYEAEVLFYKSMFGEEHPISAYEKFEDYDALTVEALLKYHADFIGSSNCRIFITGGADDTCVKTLDELFGGDSWDCDCEKNEVETKLLRFPKPLDGYNGKDIRQPMQMPTVQSALFVGKCLPMLNGKDWAALLVANMILGGYFGSRLMTNIRERKGYTYGISSSCVQTHLFNVLAIQTETANQYVDKVVQEIKGEINVMRNQLVPTEELELVKKYYSGNICRAYEANFAYPNTLMRKIGLGRDVAETLSAVRHIQEVQPEDILKAASLYMSPDDFLYCVKGGS